MKQLLITILILYILSLSWVFYKNISLYKFKDAVTLYGIQVTNPTYDKHKCDSLRNLCNKLHPPGFFELNP